MKLSIAIKISINVHAKVVLIVSKPAMELHMHVQSTWKSITRCKLIRCATELPSYFLNSVQMPFTEMLNSSKLACRNAYLTCIHTNLPWQFVQHHNIPLYRPPQIHQLR